MGPIYLLDLASRQAEWLSARQAVIAGNLANADTPGFAAQDVRRFAEVLDRTAVTLTRTAPGHEGHAAAIGVDTTSERDGRAIKHSGNSVSMEAELVKAGDVSRAFRLNTAIVGAFHNLLMTSVRS